MKRPAISTTPAFAARRETIRRASASAPSRVASEPAWTAQSAPPAEAGARNVSAPRRRSTRPTDFSSQSPAGNAADARSVASETSSVVPGIEGNAGTSGVGEGVGVAGGARVGVGAGDVTGGGAGPQAAARSRRSAAAAGGTRRDTRRSVTNPSGAA